MSPSVSLLIYLAIGCVGGLLGYYSRLPAGTLLGTVLAVIIFKIALNVSWQTPKTYGFFCQVLLGVLIGLTFQPCLLRIMASLWAPMMISTAALIACGMATAYIFAKWWPIDLPTAYIATSPGGMVALVPMAVDIHVNAALIASFHFLRIFTVVSTAPFLFKFILK